MNRLSSLVLALALTGAGVGLVSPAVRASDVHFGVSFAVPLPHGAIGITVGNSPYYYHHGSYYRPIPHGHGYHHVPPPMGACVPWLPSSYVGVVINGATYFNNGAIYYQFAPGGYRVCPPPAHSSASYTRSTGTMHSGNASASTVSAGTTGGAGWLPVKSGHETWYFLGGEFFRRTPDGYEKTEPPVGAIAQHLPEDAVSVWVDGLEYFESHGMLFRQTRGGFMVAGAR